MQYMENLLAAAKTISLKTRKATVPVTDDEHELVFAWVRGEITSGQAARAYGTRGMKLGGNVLYRFATVLRDAFQKGHIIISK